MDNSLIKDEYKYGFTTNVKKDFLEKGLNEETIRTISNLRNEPEFLLKFRLKAYNKWLSMKEPTWANITYDQIDYKDISYYSAPKKKAKLNSLDEVDPEILATFERLGIPINEQKRLTNVAVDMVFDSVSIGTTFKQKLDEAGVILCSIGEAVDKYPELIEKYLGSVISINDNFFAALNSAVFSDGSFVYIPKGVKCPMETIYLFSY